MAANDIIYLRSITSSKLLLPLILVSVVPNTGTNQHDNVKFYFDSNNIQIQLPNDSGTNICYTQQDCIDAIVDRTIEGLSCFLNGNTKEPLYMID